MRYLIISLLFFPCFPVKAQVQESKRTCRILFPQKPVDAPSEAYLFDGEKSHKVLLPSLNFSEVVELPQGEITIGMCPNMIDTPKDFPVGAPTVKISNAATDIYLLVFSDPDNKIFPVKIQPIDVGKNDLKAGQTLWINFTKHNIAAMLGTEKVLIEPLKQYISKPPLGESGYFSANFAYQPEGKGSFLPVMKKSWWHDATSRNLGFIISTGGRLPKIYTFRDRRAPKSPTKTE